MAHASFEMQSAKVNRCWIGVEPLGDGMKFFSPTLNDLNSTFDARLLQQSLMICDNVSTAPMKLMDFIMLKTNHYNFWSCFNEWLQVEIRKCTQRNPEKSKSSSVRPKKLTTINGSWKKGFLIW